MPAHTLSTPRFAAVFAGLIASCVASVPQCLAQDKTTYADHVRPIFESSCLNCHNPDRLKGDLDLTTFKATMAGGSGGSVIVPGNPEASQLFKSVAHTGEPKMPLNDGKIPDAQIESIRKWIAGGCLETSNSKPAAEMPKVSLGGTAAAVLPASTPMRMPLLTSAPTARPGAVLAIATHPGAGVVALAGQQLILVYSLDRRELVGSLPTSGDSIHTLGFTRDGRYLFAGGGVEGKSGRVRIWSVPEGQPVAVVGEELDVVLAADVDARHDRVVLGGPSRVVKIHAASDGSLLHRIVKHTDWVTALAYSPDGVLLATADRAGGVHIWEASTSAPYLSLAGHGAAVRSLDWSPDANVLATAGEDDRVKLWDMNDGHLIKEWSAHPGGTLSVRIARDGHLLTAGRDKAVKLWDANGTLIKQYPALPEIALAASIDASLERIIGADLFGTVSVWSAKDAAALGFLSPNPKPLEDRLAEATAASAKAATARAETQKASDAAAAALAAANSTADVAAKDQQTAEAAAVAAQSMLAAAQTEEQIAKLKSDQSIAAAAVAAQATTASSSHLEQSLAALKAEVDRDTKLQSDIALAQKDQGDLEAKAAEATKLAAANDDPQKRAAADAAKSAAQSATEKITGMLASASESSKKVRSALDESEKAKASHTVMLTSHDTARKESQATAAVLTASTARAKATDQALATAKSVADQTKTRAAELTAAAAKAKAPADQAAAAKDAASREARACELAIARCQAGQARAQLDTARTRLAEREAAAKPAVDAAAASLAALTATQNQLNDAQSELAAGPDRTKQRLTASEQAIAAAAAAKLAAEQAATIAAQRAADLESMSAVAATLKTRADGSPQDTALTLAATKAAEAGTSLADSTKAARDTQVRAAASHAAAEAVVAVARKAIEDEATRQAALPAAIATLREKMTQAAAAHAMCAATAQTQLLPVSQTLAEVEALAKAYAALLAAAEVP